VAAGNKDGDLRGEWPLVGHLAIQRGVICSVSTTAWRSIHAGHGMTGDLETLINIQTRLDVM